MRKAIHIETSLEAKRAIYVDAKNAESIIGFMESNPALKKKIKHIG